MSSDYRILCLAHDPAVVVGNDEWHNDPNGALAAARDRTGPVAAHRFCAERLLVGRYSYPLVEVCCPRSRPVVDPVVPWHRGYHPHTDEWIDAGWLRLLALSSEVVRAKAGPTDCWTYETARRLRHELRIAETQDEPLAEWERELLAEQAAEDAAADAERRALLNHIVVSEASWRYKGGPFTLTLHPPKPMTLRELLDEVRNWTRTDEGVTPIDQP